MSSNSSYVMGRLLQIPIVLFIVSIIAFFVIHLAPTGPSQLLLGQGATEEQVEAFRSQYHLNEPLYIQYLLWIKGIFTGSFGTSITTGQPVSKLIMDRLPVTLTLATTSFLTAVTIALPTGYISAIDQYSWKDHVATIAAFVGLSIPNFFLGILLIAVFGLYLNWLPISAGTELFSGLKRTVLVFIMPTIALGTALAAQSMRLLRSSMLDVSGQDYVKVARSKGLPEKVVNRYIVFRNALIPVVTIVALQFGFLLGGTVVIEEIFALPGIGRLLLQSVNQRDFPTMQALVLFYATSFVMVNLIADIIYSYIDPRIRYGEGGES